MEPTLRHRFVERGDKSASTLVSERILVAADPTEAPMTFVIEPVPGIHRSNSIEVFLALPLLPHPWYEPFTVYLNDMIREREYTFTDDSKMDPNYVHRDDANTADMKYRIIKEFAYSMKTVKRDIAKAIFKKTGLPYTASSIKLYSVSDASAISATLANLPAEETRDLSRGILCVGATQIGPVSEEEMSDVMLVGPRFRVPA